MSDDQRTGRELTPRSSDDGLTTQERPPTADVERFTAGPQAHTIGLTEDRASGIVRQSGNARHVAFLMSLIVILFIPLYWFYDIGIPVLGYGGRFEQEERTQQITDISRGHELYLANCARCHGASGEGGVGPPLNDQARLYNALTPDGLSGTGHYNPNYLRTVLEVGGRVVCGDANSVMPAWLAPNGPLNYREVEELIAFLTASTEDEFETQPEDHPEPGATVAPPETHQGWRDPDYTPPPGEPTPPACWRNPSGQIGGGGGGGEPSAAPIEDPGTEDEPRVIDVVTTADLRITDPDGNQLGAIAVKAGETVQFNVTNDAGFPHNFYLGDAASLEANQVASLPGVADFSSGTESFTYTVGDDADQQLQFACTIPGHYGPMHGELQVQQ